MTPGPPLGPQAGAGDHPAGAFDAYHFAFNQDRPSSSSAQCRFSTGIDDDAGSNDSVHGLMCLYPDGTPLMAYRHLVTDGYVLMGR